MEVTRCSVPQARLETDLVSNYADLALCQDRQNLPLVARIRRNSQPLFNEIVELERFLCGADEEREADPARIVS